MLENFSHKFWQFPRPFCLKIAHRHRAFFQFCMTPFSNNAQRLFQNSMLGAEILLCLGRIFKDMCTHCNLSSRLISRLNILMHMNHRSRQLKASSTCVHNTIVAYNFTPWHMQLSHISTILTNNLLANVTMCSKTLVTKSSTSQ